MQTWNLGTEILCPGDMRIMSLSHCDTGLIQELFTKWPLGAEDSALKLSHSCNISKVRIIDDSWGCLMRIK